VPGEWVELINNGTAAVDLTGWVVRDNDDTHVFAIPTVSRSHRPTIPRPNANIHRSAEPKTCADPLRPRGPERANRPRLEAWS